MYLTRWSDFDRHFDRGFPALDLFRRMDNLFRRFEQPTIAEQDNYSDAPWPRTNLYDNGTALVAYAAVPGMSEKDIKISVTGDVLSISGERTIDAPEGYSAHRQERGSVKFSRSFALPCKVDVEKTSATVKDGMLTIELAKAKEAQPRQITVKAS